MVMVVAGRQACDEEPPSQGRSVVGDKCHGCGLWGGWMMDEREEGEWGAQGSWAGLRLAFCKTKPRKGQ